MVKLLRQLRRFVSPPRCLELDSLSLEPESGVFLLSNSPRSNVESPLYIIRQNGAGRGLFSLVSSVVCHLHLAERYGLTPWVDFQHNHSEYRDDQFIESDPLHRTNPWEFFFQPVVPRSKELSQNFPLVLGSSTGFPSGYPRKMLISHVQELRDIAVRSIKPSIDLASELQAIQAEVMSGHRVLGVHFRGQEQKTMPYHPLSPTLHQMFTAIDMAVYNHGFDRIFVASEDQDYVDAVMNRYPGMAMTLPHFRTRSPLNSYRIYPRPMHKYLLGKEILMDAFILAGCDGLVSSTSNVTEFARAFNNGKYLVDLVIDNGLNAANPHIAKYLWALKSGLPEKFGGFSLKAIQHFPALP
jgi:hypothetical protein